MENQSEIRYPMTNSATSKLPFYLTYPMQNIFLEEAEYERDLNRMKSMYPGEMGRIRDLIEEACDGMEYEGSMMFDEMPDRIMIRKICNELLDQLQEEQQKTYVEEKDFEAEQYEPMVSEELKLVGSRPDPRPREPGLGLPQFIEVLLLQEMYQRRCRHRRCRRYW